MARRAVDNSDLPRWRSLNATDVLVVLADYAKRDLTFVPRNDPHTTRWHAMLGDLHFELLCTGPKFWNTRSNKGGGGAVDLAMHLLNVGFKQATRTLRDRGL